MQIINLLAIVQRKLIHTPPFFISYNLSYKMLIIIRAQILKHITLLFLYMR